MAALLVVISPNIFINHYNMQSACIHANVYAQLQGCSYLLAKGADCLRLLSYWFIYTGGKKTPGVMEYYQGENNQVIAQESLGFGARQV